MAHAIVFLTLRDSVICITLGTGTRRIRDIVLPPLLVKCLRTSGSSTAPILAAQPLNS